MLLLERCRGDAICIGNDVQVRVLRTGGRRVLLGISAPKEIPVWREELSPPAERPNKNEDNGPDEKLKILVVEDNPIHAKLIKHALSQRSFAEITTVESGEDAIRLLALRNGGTGAYRPDLVLLDLGLPGISGVEVLQVIKSVPVLRAIPVVILSCSSYDTDVSRCMTAGANAFVSKNDGYDDFRESITRIADFWMHTRRVA